VEGEDTQLGMPALVAADVNRAALEAELEANVNANLA
jgi:hypothetical protein